MTSLKPTALALSAAAALIVGCSYDPSAPAAQMDTAQGDASSAVAPAPAPAAAAPPTLAMSPMSYDQAVRCAWLATRAIDWNADYGFTTDELAAIAAAARTAANAAASREDRVVDVAGDMNAMSREEALNVDVAAPSLGTPPPPPDPEREARNRRMQDAVERARRAELNGGCRQLLPS